MKRLAPIVVLAACGSTHGHGHHGHPKHAHDAPHEHHGHEHGMPHRFEDPERWAAVFDAPERDAWQKPEVVVAGVITRDDLVVADVGAGTGYFSLRFARALARGKVVAVDLERTLLDHLAARAAKDGLTNVETRVGAPDDPGLAGVDVVFVCDTYHHIAERTAYFTKAAAALAPGGRVVIVDFRVDSERGPPRELKVAPEVVIEELGRAGLTLVARDESLPDQYFLTFGVGPTPAK